MVSGRNLTSGIEKLIHNIFTQDAYNQLVRPVDEKTGLTVVSTELKIHQIDIVSIESDNPIGLKI